MEKLQKMKKLFRWFAGLKENMKHAMLIHDYARMTEVANLKHGALMALYYQGKVSEDDMFEIDKWFEEGAKLGDWEERAQ